MTRKQFTCLWRAIREFRMRSQVKAGTMRVSEYVMTLMDDERAAANLWRKHRSAYRQMTTENLLDACRVEPGAWGKVRVRAGELAQGNP